MFKDLFTHDHVQCRYFPFWHQIVLNKIVYSQVCRMSQLTQSIIYRVLRVWRPDLLWVIVVSVTVPSFLYYFSLLVIFSALLSVSCSAVIFNAVCSCCFSCFHLFGEFSFWIIFQITVCFSCLIIFCVWDKLEMFLTSWFAWFFSHTFCIYLCLSPSQSLLTCTNATSLHTEHYFLSCAGHMQWSRHSHKKHCSVESWLC